MHQYKIQNKQISTTYYVCESKGKFNSIVSSPSLLKQKKNLKTKKVKIFKIKPKEN